MIPRIGLFRVQRKSLPPIRHIVLVDGNKSTSLCTRHELKNGELVDPERGTSCHSCTNGGWMKTIGRLNTPEREKIPV